MPSRATTSVSHMALQYIESVREKETGDDLSEQEYDRGGRIGIPRRQKMYTNNRGDIVVYIYVFSRGRQCLDRILHKSRHGERVSDYLTESIRERISASRRDGEKYSV